MIKIQLSKLRVGAVLDILSVRQSSN